MCLYFHKYHFYKIIFLPIVYFLIKSTFHVSVVVFEWLYYFKLIKYCRENKNDH